MDIQNPAENPRLRLHIGFSPSLTGLSYSHNTRVFTTTSSYISVWRWTHNHDNQVWQSRCYWSSFSNSVWLLHRKQVMLSGILNEFCKVLFISSCIIEISIYMWPAMTNQGIQLPGALLRFGSIENDEVEKVIHL